MIGEKHRLWIGLVLLALMGVTLSVGLLQHPSAYDDAYITYRYARNIALGRGFVYNPGEAVLGTTTPLYALLLAGLSLFGVDIPLLSHYLSVLGWALCVPLVYGLARVGGREIPSLLAAALVACSPLFLSALGMETTLYMLFVLSAVYFQLKARPVGAGLCAGLAFLTRWDGILVVAVILLAELLRDRKGLARAGLVCAALILPWLVYSYVTFGSIFPNTFYAKVGQGWNEGLGATEIGPFGRGLLLLGSSAYVANRLFLLWPILAIVGLISVFYRKLKWWTLLLWTAAYAGGYIVLGVLRFPWYYPPLLPALSLLVAEGIDRSAGFLSRRCKWAPARGVLAAALCILCLLPDIDWMLASQRGEIDPHTATYLQVGEWLNEETPAGSSVALLEIGIVGFYSDRTVIDTMGLVSPGMVGHLGDWMQSLTFAINNYWPDYAVALEQTAWAGLVGEPWFAEAYELETEIENDDDPTAPVRIYRRRAPFPPEEFVLDSSQDVLLDGAFVLDRMQVADNRVRAGDTVRVRLIWQALTDIDRDYRFGFDLVKRSDGQRWELARGLQPMNGGNPTVQWRAGDHVTDLHSLAVPADVEAGSYLIELLVDTEDGPALLSGLEGNPIEEISVGPVQVGASLAAPGDPEHPVVAVFADNIVLLGYDVDCDPSGSDLALTLYWGASGGVSRDYTVFAHLFSTDGLLTAQHDAPPLLPTSHWSPESSIIDLHVLSAGAGMSAGDVHLGLYSWPELERLSLVAPGCHQSEDDALILGHVSLGGVKGSSEPACRAFEWLDATQECGSRTNQ